MIAVGYVLIGFLVGLFLGTMLDIRFRGRK